MFKSYIKLMVLKQLNKETLSGYDLIKSIGTYGSKPSPGYIYPMLGDLKKKEFISVKKEGRKKIYSISQKGKNLLKNLENKNKEMIKTMADIGDKNEMKTFLRLQNPGKNNFFLHCRELEELQKLVFLFYKNKSDEKRKKMKKILKETIKKLENLK